MGSYFLAAVGAAAFRFLLGVDAGVDYDTTALSPDLCPASCPGAAGCPSYCDSAARQGEPVPRVPWALRVRPDVLFAVFNSRQYFYVSADGSFVQPLLDTYEASGEATVAARLRLGRGLALHPGAFVRAASSNELLRGQTAGTTVPPTSELFYSVSGGGWLELDLPLARRLRLVVRGEAEAWVLDLVPEVLRDAHPALAVRASVATLLALTRVDGLAAEAQATEGLYFPSGEPAQHQVSLTGRVIYRRFWLPHLMTDLSVGMVGLRERDGAWSPNLAAGAMLVMAGRPRWLALNLSYERRFEYVSLYHPGAMQDVLELLAAFGPWSGFGVQLSVLWNRTELEVESRLVQGQRVDRPFHSIGANLELRYLHEVGGFGFGPLLEAYVFSPFAEERPYDLDYEYLPPGYDTVEAVVFLALRVQWGSASARATGQMGDGGMVGGARSRTERRLSAQRLTREEREVPTFAWGMRRMTATEADEEELFRDRDPFGRVQGEYEEEGEAARRAAPAEDGEPGEDGEPADDGGERAEDDDEREGDERDEDEEEGEPAGEEERR